MKTCYVSIPIRINALENGIDIDFNYLYKEIIKPTAAEAGFEVFRADEWKRNVVIQKTIISAVFESDLVIADISSRNPNILYELGLRHADRRLRTIVLCNMQTRVPFDLSQIHVVRYELAGWHPTEIEGRVLRRDLNEAIRESGADDTRFKSPLNDLFSELRLSLPQPKCVFLGHGRSRLWKDVERFLERDLDLKVVSYESESRAGEHIVAVLDDFLRTAGLAVLVLTAEDETVEGGKRARQNVIHEAGLFQGALGFRRAILLYQEGVEDFSNVAGLQHIPFDGDRIEHVFWDLKKALEKLGIVDRRHGRRSG